MAGYIEKGSPIYQGELVNGASAAVANGVLMVAGTSTNAGKLIFPAQADTTSKFICTEVTTIYDGITAYRFIVNKLNDAYYFIENGFEAAETLAYDNTEYTTPVGKHLRAHPLAVGDSFVTAEVTGTPTVGTAYGVKADGTIG